MSSTLARPWAATDLSGPDGAVQEVSRLRAENATLRAERARAFRYVREKTDQLLGVMGTVPLRPEELDDDTLLDLDPLGILAGAFGQVLEHMHGTHQELKAAHTEIETVFDSAGVGIVVLDPSMRIVSFNRHALATVLGGNEAAAGRPCFEAICGQDRPVGPCTFEQGVVLRQPFRRTGWAQGDRRYDVCSTPLFDANGGLSRVVLTYLDITERQAAVEALAESEEKYRDLFENANDLIQSVAPDGSFLYANRAWLRTLGYAREDLTSLTIFDVIAPDCREHCETLFRAVLAGEDVGRIEVDFTTKEGRHVLLEGTANCRFQEGRPVATRAIFRDITERRRMESDVARAEQLESLGLLAGGIAHDFNNLLTAILGNVSLARLRSGPDGPTAANLQEAEKAVARAQDLTRQLLTFSRGGAPVRKETSVGEIAAESVRFALSGSRTGSLLDLEPGLWSAEVDAAQIGQVLQNLVLNADQSMPAGGRIRVEAVNEALAAGNAFLLPPGPYVRVSVADQGVGIRPEDTGRVFDPYFTTKPGGSGLGLTTAYSIVQRHGGHLSFESQPGFGTVFHVHLPATGRTASPAPPCAEVFPRGGGRVLLMDDEEMIRLAAGDMLEFLGYRVETAPGGAQALDKYREAVAAGDPFDAVILDLTVPGGMGGTQTVERLRELDPGVRAVASTGYSHDPVLADHRAYGFRAAVPKPYRMDALASILEALLAEERG